MKNLPALLALCLILMTAAGCMTEVDGHRIRSTRWVDGQVVYDLAPTADEKAALKKGAAEIKEATKAAVVGPVARAPAAASGQE